MINAFKSRTNWVVVIAVALSVIQSAEPMLEPEVFALIQTLLGAFAVYFRTVPKQVAE